MLELPPPFQLIGANISSLRSSNWMCPDRLLTVNLSELMATRLLAWVGRIHACVFLWAWTGKKRVCLPSGQPPALLLPDQRSHRPGRNGVDPASFVALSGVAPSHSNSECGLLFYSSPMNILNKKRNGVVMMTALSVLQRCLEARVSHHAMYLISHPN